MVRRLAAILALAVVAAGCGSASGGNSIPDAASIVPQSALAYATINTNQGSDQFSSAKAVLDKFPGGAELVAEVKKDLAGNGVDLAKLGSSIGPVLDIAAFELAGEKYSVVGFVQPTDQQTFLSELAKDPSTVHAQVDGWTVFGESKAVDLVKNRTANLADAADYQAAVATIPDPANALARAYASPTLISDGIKAGLKKLATTSIGGLETTKWVAAALTSSNGAAKLELHASTSASSGATAAGSLADQIPSGATAAASLSGAGSFLTGGLDKELQLLPKGLGTALRPVLGALGGPVIAYVRPGAPLPEVTIAAKPEHPAAVAAGVGALIKNLTGSSATPANISGATMLKASVSGFAIYYGTTDDGRVVVTDSANAVAELNGSAGKLADDSGFKDAKSAAGMPDDAGGFLYVDVKELLPTVEGIAQLVGKTIPPHLDANLKPVDTVLAYGSREGDITTVVAYVKTT